MDWDDVDPRLLFGGIQTTLVAIFMAALPGDLPLAGGILLLLVGTFLVFNALLG
jgi:hypothetical protein